MAKNSAQPRPAAAANPYEANRHRVYVDGDLMTAFDAACGCNARNRSEVFTRLARTYIRQNAPKLRKAGIKIPEDVFVERRPHPLPQKRKRKIFATHLQPNRAIQSEL